MTILTCGAAKRLLLSLLFAGALAGCAGPPAATNRAAHGEATRVPPVAFDLGFGFYDFGYLHQRRGYEGDHGIHRGHRGTGYRAFRRGQQPEAAAPAPSR